MNASTARSPTIVAAGGGRRYRVLTDDYTCLFNAGRESGWAIFTQDVPAGGATPLHRHEHYEEAMFVLAGEIDMQVGDHGFVARPGHFVHIPRGTAHGARNCGQTAARALILTLPGIVEDFFAEVDLAGRNGNADVGEVLAIAARHHIQTML